MKSKLSLVTSVLLLANINLFAEQNVEANFTSTTDTPIHNYYDFSTPVHKISNAQRDYYRSIGLKDHESSQKAINDQYQKLSKTPKEIFDGFSLTIDAMTALDNNKTSQAQKSLTEASQTFEKVFKAHPEMKMVPIDMDVEVEEHEITNENVKTITQNAIRMLKENDPQEAMVLLKALKNQITITTLYLPMEFYELGTKAASEALKKGDEAKAISALSTGFESLIAKKSVIPISLLDSQVALLAASVVDKSNKEEINKLLDVAKNHLEQARLLGYTTKYDADYQVLTNQIHALQKEIKGKNEVEKLYDTLKKDYHKLVNKIVGK